MKKLNSDKPYGRIVGHYEECPGAAFSQDGAFFDAYKNLILQEGNSHGENDGWKNEEGSHVEINGNGEGQEKDDERQEENGLLDNSLSESEPVPVLEPELDSEPYMSLTDQQLEDLAESGMGPLRDYATMFGVKGVSKKQLITGLKAQR